HHLAEREVDEPPGDRRERRGDRVGHLVVIRPRAGSISEDRPAPGDRFPEELVVGQVIDALSQIRVRLVHPASEQLGGRGHGDAPSTAACRSGGYRSRSTRSARSCSTARWHSWIVAVESLGILMDTSASGPSRPPERPVRAITSSSRSCASRAARTTFSELPLVEIATSASPGRPSASSCREKTPSPPKSFVIAVSSDVSVVIARAAIEGLG